MQLLHTVMEWGTSIQHLLFFFFIVEAWSFSGRKEIPACYLFPLQLPCEDGSPIFLPRSDRVPKYFSPNLFYSAVSIGNLQPMLLLNGNEIIGCTLRRWCSWKTAPCNGRLCDKIIGRGSIYIRQASHFRHRYHLIDLPQVSIMLKKAEIVCLSRYKAKP